MIARHAEAAGIATLSLTSALDITRAVNPPRAAFLDFPLGHTAGKPHDPVLGRAIVESALEGFESIREPGGVKMLPFRWDADDAWKASAMTGTADERAERSDEPQYQTEEDRRRAESCGR